MASKGRSGDEPGRGGKAGLQEFGLPFVSDPAIPKHPASFLRRHKAQAIGQGGLAEIELPAREGDSGRLSGDQRDRASTLSDPADDARS